MTTVQIKLHLKDINIILKPRQLNTFIAAEKENDSPRIKLISHFEQWCKSNAAVPDDAHQGFVSNYEVKYRKGDKAGKECRAFFTTRHLLKNAETGMVLHADGTYKLMSNGFPGLELGTSDANAKFNLIGICVSSGEKEADFKFMFESFKAACDQFGVHINIT